MGAQDNYVTADNLRARIAIHGYATNTGWTRWLFEREVPQQPGPVRILDVGCGTGVLWADNEVNIRPDWILTLADSSEGMLGSARETFGERASYVVADIENLPFANDSFDVVVANHMLYHVGDRPRALREIIRVLTPAGVFHCSTNGHGHLAELHALEPDLMRLTTFTETFGLETGPPQLAPYFAEVTVEHFDNSLKVPSAEPMLAYIRSSERYDPQVDLTATQDTIEAEIRRSGAFSITTKPGLISCRHPIV